MTFSVKCSVPRPHIPISKLAVSESYDTYISRSFQVTREILTECKNLGTVELGTCFFKISTKCLPKLLAVTFFFGDDYIYISSYFSLFKSVRESQAAYHRQRSVL